MATDMHSDQRRWTGTEIRGTRLAWTRTGQGPVTVWAHPLGSSGLGFENHSPVDWEPVAADGRSLIRYDARGHGRSAGRPEPRDYSFESLALDLLALLDVWSPDAPVNGVGTSLGTATLLHAAVLAPDRFDRLVLTAPPTAWETRAQQGGLYASLAGLVEDQGVAAVEAALRGAPVPAPFQGAPGFPPPLEVDEELLPALLRGVGASDLPAKERVAGLRQEVLLLPWADDPTHPVSTAETLAGLLPNARMRVAHSAQDLEEWGRRAAAFLAG
jgi:3-oxoadipate enol-lactonase